MGIYPSRLRSWEPLVEKALNKDEAAKMMPDDDGKSVNPKMKRLARLFWRLALPYWRRNRSARYDLAIVLLFTLLQSAVSVTFSYISRGFWSALNEKNYDSFMRHTALFFVALCVFSPINVYYSYFRDKCALRWRYWLTRTVLQLYIDDRNYYRLDMLKGDRVDNPDQRIADDLNSFTHESLNLGLTVVVAVVDLIAFSAILFFIYPSLLISLVAYASLGTALMVRFGRALVTLKYKVLEKEADFRYSLIRVRENAESVAFFGGERIEQMGIERRLEDVLAACLDVIGLQRNLSFLRVSYNYLVAFVPAVLVAPLYFQGRVPLGVVTQSFSAFRHILNDLSLVINRNEQLSKFGAGIERLGTFAEILEKNLEDSDKTFKDNALEGNDKYYRKSSNVSAVLDSPQNVNVQVSTPRSSSFTDVHVQETNISELVLRNLTLFTPSGESSRRLFTDLSITLKPGQRLLITGKSGAGKSSLLRAVAGLWNVGTGIIERPPRADIFFLPQRPYCMLGSLRANILYPHANANGELGIPSDVELMNAMRLVDLHQLPGRMGGLDAVCDWSDTLSLGEQQRLQLVRLLIAKPRFAIIDEGSAALSSDAEACMYELLGKMGITVVSVGHRPSLLKYHDVLLRLLGTNGEWEISEIGPGQRDRSEM